MSSAQGRQGVAHGVSHGKQSTDRQPRKGGLPALAAGQRRESPPLIDVVRVTAIRSPVPRRSVLVSLGRAVRARMKLCLLASISLPLMTLPSRKMPYGKRSSRRFCAALGTGPPGFSACRGASL
ncbi:hypothetical protein SBA4_7600008 [Candidatus Sulfopaludibacter sp. SbA4]|nr:hypothetical protein SBA4_7600008 [Candidatus Sulfopaludibacter sp. SbA4]